MGINSTSPIGIFDSGLGGLTVARAIKDALPGEDLVYLGDTARVPYGTRSPETITRYARACARKLQEHGLKYLVVACNTVSAVALDMLRVELDMPVLGVIEPGARAGVAATRKKHLGVIATHGTIASGAYVRAVAGIDSRIELISQPAPLLVPLVEEGWTTGDVPRLAVRRYLEAFRNESIDALVLGCTHYPLLAETIRAEAADVCGTPVTVVDSARATAIELDHMLQERGMKNARSGGGTLSLLVTDLPGRFRDVASRFLGVDVETVHVEQVDL